jgi:hypothetical protein
MLLPLLSCTFKDVRSSSDRNHARDSLLVMQPLEFMLRLGDTEWTAESMEEL